jgi:hypothetical protein
VAIQWGPFSSDERAVLGEEKHPFLERTCGLLDFFHLSLFPILLAQRSFLSSSSISEFPFSAAPSNDAHIHTCGCSIFKVQRRLLFTTINYMLYHYRRRFFFSSSLAFSSCAISTADYAIYKPHCFSSISCAMRPACALELAPLVDAALDRRVYYVTKAFSSSFVVIF